jgi:hypothetical protein
MCKRDGGKATFLSALCLPVSLTHTLTLYYLCTFYRTTRDKLSIRSTTSNTLFAVSDHETRSLSPKRSPLDSSLPQTPAHHVLRRRWIQRRRSRWRPRLLERVRKQQCWIWVLQQLDKPIRIVRVGRYTPPLHGRGITVAVLGSPSTCYLSSIKLYVRADWV